MCGVRECRRHDRHLLQTFLSLFLPSTKRSHKEGFATYAGSLHHGLALLLGFLEAFPLLFLFLLLPLGFLAKLALLLGLLLLGQLLLLFSAEDLWEGKEA